MEKYADSESYWNVSHNNPFNFDDDRHLEPGTILDSKKTATLETHSLNYSEASNSSLLDVLPKECVRLILKEQTYDMHVSPKIQMSDMQTSSGTLTLSNKLISGETVLIENYRSIREKMNLLDTALASGGGDSVCGIIMFLKKTLSPDQFIDIISKRPTAIDHYVSYLMEVQSPKSFETLCSVGRYVEAVLFLIIFLQKKQDISLSKRVYRKILDSPNIAKKIPTIYYRIMCSFCNLLNKFESKTEKLPDILNTNSSPVEFLYAFSRNSRNWEKNVLSKFSLENYISTSQYQWTILNERVTSGASIDFEKLFEIFLYQVLTQQQFRVSFAVNTAIIRLAELQAPTAVMSFFVDKIRNPNQKLKISEQLSSVKEIVDSLVAIKDVNTLLLLNKFLQEPEDKLYCEQAVQNIKNNKESSLKL